ncbi:MAG: DNA-deoxyinosine glycosylase [Firmicutes bacterium]|nr:DNA-deoxyinosine glycosylase [Bacillota bacterium]
MIQHPFPPHFRADSRILILGSFPSVKSREQGFFYGHPQNRFWQVTAAVFARPVPRTIQEKSRFLDECGIALWDVIASCEITGSQDSSIRSALPNDLTPILSSAPIEAIFVNGRTAEKLYQSYLFPVLGRKATYLPSTSPANAAWSLDKLIQAWQVIRR